MKHHPRMRRVERASVATVAAIAAIAAIAACGGRAENTSSSPSAPAHSPSPDGGSCPVAVPPEHSACDVLGARCDYGQCEPGVASIECVPDGWAYHVVACEPPGGAVPPSPTGCPAQEPLASTPCTTDARDVCAYHKSQCNFAGGYISERDYVCADGGVGVPGVWTVVPTPECPPATNICPSTVPTNGALCRTAPECSYGDCNGKPTTIAKCLDDNWHLLYPPCIPPSDAGSDG